MSPCIVMEVEIINVAARKTVVNKELKDCLYAEPGQPPNFAHIPYIGMPPSYHDLWNDLMEDYKSPCQARPKRETDRDGVDEENESISSHDQSKMSVDDGEFDQVQEGDTADVAANAMGHADEGETSDQDEMKFVYTPSLDTLGHVGSFRHLHLS